MPKLSDFVAGTGNGVGGSASGNNTLVAKASRFAIAVNDLLYMTSKGDLYPAQTASWAAPASSVGSNNGGAALIAETTVVTNTNATNNDVKQACWVSPLDQCIFILAMGSGSQVMLTKYSPAGVALLSLKLDDVGATNYGAFNLIQLSNGNLAQTWSTGGNAQFFSICDTDLNPLVAKTAITGPAATTNGNGLYAVALSGGGFAVTIAAPGTSTATAVYLAIYSNSGAVVRASAAIANTTLLGNYARCAQLSDGTIVVAISSTTVNQALGVASFTAAGVAALAYTVLENSQGSAGMPELAVVPGYFAVASQLTTGGTATAKAFVLSNAGVLQGAALPFSMTSNGISPMFRMRADGTYFWIMCQAPSSAGVWICRLSTTGGASAVVSTFPLVIMTGTIDFFIERDFIVHCIQNAVYALSIRSDGTVVQYAVSTTPWTLTGAANPHTFKPAGDFTVLAYSPSEGSNSSKFRVARYLDASIIGVAQNGVAAGAAGTLVSMSVGPVALPINPLPGPAQRAFDHQSSTPNVVGNKGYILQNSVVLKGY
ncbi:hypothetical protein FHW83_004746 [Duganella sp. SG902]|uniref:hypothetical protein n=1 Tax=Duganella sp. SG902 TaxID=2587016 RepID=UPI00159D1B69|nr:hypothetical protein [Duganella sp. SG902]NVM78915.1 hypothetical protein [Duganella sp. SG902]